MFTFLKNKFSNNPEEKYKRIFQNLKFSTNDWCLFLINKNYWHNSHLTREIDLYQSNKLLQFKMSEGVHINEFEVVNTIRFQSKSYEIISNTNALFDELIQNQINHFAEVLNKHKNVNTLNLATEEKAYEWIRVSFKILNEAITKAKEDKEISLSLSLYFGNNPKTHLNELRILIFNLDISYVLLEDGNLRVVIYNDQDKAFGFEKKPSLKGDFSLKKYEMFEEVIFVLKNLQDTIHLS